MKQIICVANQKGGVGKTTTALTVAHGLALKGRKVLLVDLDVQGHVPTALGLPKEPGLYRLLVLGKPLRSVITEARQNLDIIAGDKQTEEVKRYVATLNFRERVLAKALEGAAYDVVILDCAPSLDVLHVGALVASNFVIVPTKLDFLAIDGVNEVLRSAAEVQQAGYDVGIAGILPTFYDRVTRESAEQLRRLVAAFKALVWPPIPQDVKLREAPAFGQTIWEYSPSTAGVKGYPSANGHNLGGYQSIVERLLEVIDG
jgi:chromosome partitioning protein